MFLEVGRRNWAHCTATGKVLLAHLPDDRLDRLLVGWELKEKTPHTITDHQLLREELMRVRRRGWAHNRYESEPDHLSVGAPVRNAMGDVVAAMSVVGPARQMDPALDRITMELLEAAAAGSRRMGYRNAAP
jgi:DNA-binding IclR family transcriptional regulator